MFNSSSLPQPSLCYNESLPLGNPQHSAKSVENEGIVQQTVPGILYSVKPMLKDLLLEHFPYTKTLV